MLERFTAAARNAVLNAAHEAEQQNAAHVAAEHLVLALAGDPTTTAGSLLAECGVERADITNAFHAARRRGGLSESDGEALRELGIEVSEVVDSVEKSLGRGALSPRPRRRRGCFAPRNHVPFSREAKQLLEGSLREARELRERRIGDEHLLLAVLVRGGVATEVLAEHDLTYVGVRTRHRKAS